ncbi:MAG TPA: hypothetical protein VFZ61_11255 [Polyangiales bacterium]
MERELIAVARARSLVHTAPKRALDLLGSMVRDFPNGYFREERSALRVIALTEAHSREAIGAAQQHLAAYPNGPFSDRVRQLLERAR